MRLDSWTQVQGTVGSWPHINARAHEGCIHIFELHGMHAGGVLGITTSVTEVREMEWANQHAL